MDLVVLVYKITLAWPKDELYGLTSQAKRSAVSVPANIAEGYGRDNLGSYVQFLNIAQGSLKELETHFEVAFRVGLIGDDHLADVVARTQETGKILRALIKKLSESNL